MIRWITKIILFLISLLLSIITAFLTFLLNIGIALLYIIMVICVFVAFGSFFMLHNPKAVIEALIIGFLLSTYGLPMIGATVIAFMRDEVSKDDNWRVQEVLAKAFDEFCKKIGYEKALPIIDEWLKNNNPNTRRAVTEGLRIWTNRPYFKDNPNEVYYSTVLHLA